MQKPVSAEDGFRASMGSGIAFSSAGCHLDIDKRSRRTRDAGIGLARRTEAYSQVPVTTLDRLIIRQREELPHECERHADDVDGRGNQQLQIEPESSVVDVVQVVSQLTADAFQVGVRGKLNLGEPRDTRPNPTPQAGEGQSFFEVRNELRTLR